MATKTEAAISTGGGGMGADAAWRPAADRCGVARRRARIPMGRYGWAEEVSSLISYLASQSAAYEAGRNIRIDGGLTRGVWRGAIDPARRCGGERLPRDNAGGRPIVCGSETNHAMRRAPE